MRILLYFVFQIENLLGDLGGQLGLWLGLTVISVWEIVEYIGLLLRCLCCTARKSDRNGKSRAYHDDVGDGVDNEAGL